MPAILTLPKNTIICTSVITQPIASTPLRAIPDLCRAIAIAYASEFAGMADIYYFTIPDRIDHELGRAIQSILKRHFRGEVSVQGTAEWGPDTYCFFAGDDPLPNFAFRIPR